MARYLWQLDTAFYGCPVIVAGDLFHKWDSPPELINFAIKWMPKDVVAVPGNHDLPEHRYDQIKRSAYWTLVEAGKIEDLPPGVQIRINKFLTVTGFPHGHTPTPPEGGKLVRSTARDSIELAVIHDYVWINGKSFPGCPVLQHADQWSKRLVHCGFDAAHFGDNHKGFRATSLHGGPGGGLELFNAGTFLRNNVDEVAYAPMFGLLHRSGKISECHFETTKDVMTVNETTTRGEEPDLNELEQFVAALKDTDEIFFDFRTSVENFMRRKNISHEVREVVLKLIGGGRGNRT